MMNKTFLFYILWLGLFYHTSLFGQYSYPSVPDSILKLEDRASYLSDHWWDNTNLSDTSLFQTPKVILDYLYVIGLLSQEEKERGLIRTIHKLSIEPHNLEMAISWLKKYYHDATSPYYDDGLYLQVIDSTLELNALPNLQPWLKSERILALRNMKGSPAEDFSLLTNDGKSMKMSDISSPWLLIVFNNPECSRCIKIQQHIFSDTLIEELIDDGLLKILSICPVGDYDSWQEHNYPDNWINGFDIETAIVSRQLYEIQYFPALYLLDSEKRVCIKEGQNIGTITDFLRAAIKKGLCSSSSQ